MGRCPWSVSRLVALVLLLALFSPPLQAFAAGRSPQTGISAQPAAGQPIKITADRIEYFQSSETYEAEGSVVAIQGPLRLTADHVTLQMLSGNLTATGKVHLSELGSELWAERLELNINTDVGVITEGKLYIRDSNTLVTGRLLQRFSETHVRAKEGSFTNCDAKEGQIPAWRFKFKDVDIDLDESLSAQDVWFCINDMPMVPLPTLSFPVQTARKTGLLMPTIGYDNRFGAHYRQGFYWVINPSQDMTLTPDYLSNRGYGGDWEYRYILDRRSKGEWLASFIRDTKVNRDRFQVLGMHVQQVNPDLSIRANMNLLSDRTILNNLSNSGVLRAVPSQESNLNINQRFEHGNMYLLGQYLQPVGAGGPTTFQRFPEVGHRVLNVAPLGGPILLGMDTTYVHWAQEKGFDFNRVDLSPTLETELLNVGHVVGFKPQVRLRETYYTRRVDSEKATSRETFWAALEATSRLARRFSLQDGRSLLHTIEPNVIYEYVPPTDQSKIIQIDDVDDLRKKNLLTYVVRSRLLEQRAQGESGNWLDLTLAQSYHLGGSPGVAPHVSAAPGPFRKFSDIWLRMVIGNPVGVPPGAARVSLTVDSFYDPYRTTVSQWNTDLRVQNPDLWYADIGQRYTRAGNRVRRGDIWNPISFNEVFAPTGQLEFATVSAAFKTPLGWTLGARTYYDLKGGGSPETDVVGLYQNPCKCWSLGLYYIQFPDRAQYNFLISLTGLGASQSFATETIKSILSPLLIGDRAVPWPTPYKRPPPPEAPAGVMKP